ncbi:MAG: GGDEF domain-containing protein, partial [Myxococcota bacterium]
VASHSFRINGGRELQATCSIGFAPFPLLPERPDAVSWQETVELADQALYSVKQGPRNGWAGWSAQSHAKPKAPLAEWVHQALQAGELRTERSFDQAI